LLGRLAAMLGRPRKVSAINLVDGADVADILQGYVDLDDILHRCPLNREVLADLLS